MIQYNIHCSLLQVLQHLGLSDNQARVPHWTGTVHDWTNYSAEAVSYTHLTLPTILRV